ncbi:MAG TPA: glycosyltransferase, partial [Vicinamibacterales bacterium]|nr:glycosyltransferase [Vicinamibacterales bacterium]
VTRVGGNPELVVEGEEGYLVPRGNAEEAARAMLALLDDPVHARTLGAAGHRRVVDRFQLDTSIARYAELYEAAAARLRGIPAGSRPSFGSSRAIA